MDLLTAMLLGGGGGGGGGGPITVGDVFSVDIYTGNRTVLTITNGIDLAGEGGMVWILARGNNGQSNNVIDTERGAGNHLFTNSTTASISFPLGLTSFNTAGFTLGSNSQTNFNDPYASWTFRKAPRFFDVVTYTGDGVAGRQVAHSLGLDVGMILYKDLTNPLNWAVYHRAAGAALAGVINSAGAFFTSASLWNTAPSSSVFTIDTASNINANGDNYAAYVFAHDTTTEGFIYCDSFITDGSGNATIVTGWPTQYVMLKASSVVGNWMINDSTRANETLFANLAALNPSSSNTSFTATGFTATGLSANETYIYMAIRAE